MCENGVNPSQLQAMVKMVGDSVGLAKQSIQGVRHQAEHAEFQSVGDLARAEELLAEAHALLSGAAESLGTETGHSHVHVELV